jgi:hypothetical protein
MLDLNKIIIYLLKSIIKNLKLKLKIRFIK